MSNRDSMLGTQMNWGAKASLPGPSNRNNMDMARRS